MEELNEEQIGLNTHIYNKTFNIKANIIDSTHHTYKRKKRINITEDIELDKDEFISAYKIFKNDLNNKLDED